MNFSAAATFFEPAGMARLPCPQPVGVLPKPGIRREREADLVGNLGILRIGHEGGRDRGIDPHRAFAGVEQRQIFIEAVRACAGRACHLHQVDIGRQRLLPFRRVELRLPLLVEPARAERIGHRGQERHVLAPAGLAAQADAVDAGGLVGELLRRIDHEIPGRLFRHRQAGLLEQVGAIHHHRALAIERRGIELARHRDGIADLGKQIGGVVVGPEIVERNEPVLLGPDRNLVGADGEHVELPALGRDIGGDALAQDVLFERHPLHGDVRIFGGELAGQPLHPDHVAIVHGGDRQGCLCDRGG